MKRAPALLLIFVCFYVAGALASDSYNNMQQFLDLFKKHASKEPSKPQMQSHSDNYGSSFSSSLSSSSSLRSTINSYSIPMRHHSTSQSSQPVDVQSLLQTFSTSKVSMVDVMRGSPVDGQTWGDYLRSIQFLSDQLANTTSADPVPSVVALTNMRNTIKNQLASLKELKATLQKKLNIVQNLDSHLTVVGDATLDARIWVTQKSRALQATTSYSSAVQELASAFKKFTPMMPEISDIATATSRTITSQYVRLLSESLVATDPTVICSKLSILNNPNNTLTTDLAKKAAYQTANIGRIIEDAKASNSTKKL